MKPRGKLVCGVGINDAQYYVTKHDSTGKKIVWACPYYEKWRAMIKRCYMISYHIRNPTYKGCSVCEEWLTFSNFKAWMELQQWEGNELDKDLLVKGNKQYSPSTCLFIPNFINNFICLKGRMRGKHPLGVYEQKTKYKSPYMCKIQVGQGYAKQKYVGVFTTVAECHKAWQSEKIKRGKELRAMVEDPLILKGLDRVLGQLEYELKNGIITNSL